MSDVTPLRTQAYDPYGFSPLGLEQGALGFNGWSRQSIAGLYLLGNGYRAYNPALRRFLSPDSWSPFGRGEINSYVYCKCDPVNFQDDSGHMSGRERGRPVARNNHRRLNSTGSSSSDSTSRSSSPINLGHYSTHPIVRQRGGSPVNNAGQSPSPHRRSSSSAVIDMTPPEALQRVPVDIGSLSDFTDVFSRESLDGAGGNLSMQRPESAHLNSMINAGLGLDEELFLRNTDIRTTAGIQGGESLSSQTLESINRERMDQIKRKTGSQ